MPSLELRLLDRRVQLVADDPDALRVATLCLEELPRAEDDGRLAIDLAIRVSLDPAAESGDFDFRVDIDPTSEAPQFDDPSCPETLVGDLLSWTIAGASQHHVFHAASVSRDGVGVLMPGESGAGKSTLSLALAQRGFEILSDEVALVALENAEIVGFPRALMLRPDGLASLGYSVQDSIYCNSAGSLSLRASDLSLRRAGRSRASLIVVPRYEEGSATRFEAMAPSAAAMALLETSVSLPRFKERGVDFAIDLARRLPCFALRFSKTAEAIEVIERAVEDAAKGSRTPTTRDEAKWRSLDLSAALADDRPTANSRLLRREVDGELFVYDPIQDSVALLNGSAAIVLDLCDGTRSVAQIVREVAENYGMEPGIIEGDVRQALSGLAQSGFVRALHEDV